MPLALGFGRSALFLGSYRRFWAALFINQMTPGILTTCASCAVPIPYTAPRCSKCHTRYCGPECQTQHWNTGGHNRALCKRIKRGGGAEKYHANQKYDEAVAEAVETCSAHVPEGATCYICTEAVVQRTGEGLVNGFCACGDRDGVDAGTTGVAHVSCLVRDAELAQDDEMLRSFHQDRNERWHTCRLCGKKYHGDVERAMGWAWWRANLSRSPQGPPPIRHGWARKQLSLQWSRRGGARHLQGNLRHS